MLPTIPVRSASLRPAGPGSHHPDAHPRPAAHFLRAPWFGNRSAFTLIEMLAAMAIVGLLLAFLVPAVTKARKSAYAAAELNGLRRLGSAMISYAADNENRINQVSYSNPSDKWPDYFWTRAAPYLDSGILDGNLTVAKLKSVADQFNNRTLAEMDTRYLGYSAGGSESTRVIEPFAFNTTLFDYHGGPGATKGTSRDHFRRLTEYPSPSTTPYIVVGRKRFFDSQPGPMPNPDSIPEGVFWPYPNQSTIVVYLDGHAEMRSKAITQNECWGLGAE